MYTKYLHIFSNSSILVDYCFPDVCIFSDADGNAASFKKGFLVIFRLHKNVHYVITMLSWHHITVLFDYILPHNSLHPLAGNPLLPRLPICTNGVQQQNGWLYSAGQKAKKCKITSLESPCSEIWVTRIKWWQDIQWIRVIIKGTKHDVTGRR